MKVDTVGNFHIQDGPHRTTKSLVIVLRETLSRQLYNIVAENGKWRDDGTLTGKQLANIYQLLLQKDTLTRRALHR